MFENQPGTDDTRNRGWVGRMAYDANREKIGTITTHNMQAGYFVAQKGMFFPHDVYIPVDAVASADANSVYLNLTSDQLRDERYKAPQTTGGTTAAAATGTARPALRTVAGDSPPAPQTSDRVGKTVKEATPATVKPQEIEDITVPLREETLTANRTREQIGSVRVHRYVIQEDETIEAPVTHEEVTIEHVARSDLPVGTDAFTDKDVDVPLMGERLTLGKQAHVADEVHIHKRLVTEQQYASGSVRREQIRVEGDTQDMLPRSNPPASQDSGIKKDPPR
jgi:uncharacterized protein (TIGR02271 family)